ncbi:MAG: hypothetical protein K8L99_05050 [Anaerolineae bacterium]|nr:hypothetical protein [Anaerolineae bacterium]
MFEFDNVYDDTPVPLDGETFIFMSEGRCIVARCRYIDDEIWTWDYPTNLDEIQAQLIQYLNHLGCYNRIGQTFQCPEAIHAHLEWSSSAA